MTGTDKPVANPLVVLREEFDDWAVLFNPSTADAVGINPVGVAVWKRMDGTRTLNEIIADVQGAFTDVPDSVTSDIPEFVSKLEEQGLVGYALQNRTGI